MPASLRMQVVVSYEAEPGLSGLRNELGLGDCAACLELGNGDQLLTDAIMMWIRRFGGVFGFERGVSGDFGRRCPRAAERVSFRSGGLAISEIWG